MLPCESDGSAWVVLCARRKIFSEVCEIPASVSSESRTVRWRKLTVKRRAAARRKGREGGAGGNLPLRQHCESAHLAESCAAAAATDPPTPTGDEKGRENERRTESRCGASRLSRARARERKRKRDRKGEKEREREERCAGVWMLRFQLRIRPAKISTPLDAGNRIGTGYATISTDTINDAFCTGRSAQMRKSKSARVSRPTPSTIVPSLSAWNECERGKKKKKKCQRRWPRNEKAALRFKV